MAEKRIIRKWFTNLPLQAEMFWVVVFQKSIHECEEQPLVVTGSLILSKQHQKRKGIKKHFPHAYKKMPMPKCQVISQ